jgi:NAD(P)-dependent dehydrogenase (short-subunit alcohol dehydrogenase family)
MRPLALVTGGSKGIGLAIARKLAQHGFDLFVTGLGPDAGGIAETLHQYGGAVTYLVGDISDLDVHDAWMDAVRRGPARIDCLVNNAGMGAVVRGDVLDLAPENFDRVMAVNLRGTAFLTQAVLKLMLTQSPGPVPPSIRASPSGSRKTASGSSTFVPASSIRT